MAARFPLVTGSNLEGKTFDLPADFEGAVTLALVAFRRNQQTLIDTWLPDAREFEAAFPDFRYYELPVISRFYRPTQWIIDGGMRAGIPDRTARERTITLYTDKATFKKALEIPTETTIFALLLDLDGTVVWRARGGITTSSRAGLREAIEARLATEGRPEKSA